MEKLEAIAAKGYGIEYATTIYQDVRVNLRKRGEIFACEIADAPKHNADLPPRYQDRLEAEFGEVSDEMRAAFWAGCASVSA